jgi:hypothetical protein
MVTRYYKEIDVSTPGIIRVSHLYHFLEIVTWKNTVFNVYFFFLFFPHFVVIDFTGILSGTIIFPNTIDYGGLKTELTQICFLKIVRAGRLVTVVSASM